MTEYEAEIANVAVDAVMDEVAADMAEAVEEIPTHIKAIRKDSNLSSRVHGEVTTVDWVEVTKIPVKLTLLLCETQ